MNSTRYPAATLLGLVLAEAAVWHGIGASFLVAYAGLHSVGQAAVLAHLSLVTIVWGYVVCIRIGVWRFVPSHHGARAVNALTVTLALATLLAYYAAVLVGLHSWGRVVTWRLIETYSRDSVDLLHTLGVSPIFAFVGLALTMLGAAFGLAWATVRIGWVRDLSRRLSSPVALICVLAGASILTVRVPFLLFEFGGAAARPLAQAGLSSQLDIAPTLLARLRMRIPSTWSGRPLQQAPNRSFVRFQQGARVGLFDLRSPGRIWKYFLDIATGEEFAVDATDSVDESRNRIAEVPADLRNEWKRQVMEAGSAVVVRNECCVAQARLN